jgi:hypothetical protein
MITKINPLKIDNCYKKLICQLHYSTGKPVAYLCCNVTGFGDSTENPNILILQENSQGYLQHYLQQVRSFGVLLAFGCVAGGVISHYCIVVSGLLVNTYETSVRVSNPAVPGSNPGGRDL